MIELYKKILNLRETGGEGVLVTVVAKEDHGPAPVQAKMLVLRDGKKLGTVGGGALEFAAVQTADLVIASGKPQMKRYLLDPDNNIIDGEDTGMLCGGSTTLFFEYIGPGQSLYIFGAGHIGRVVVNMLKNLDFHITVIDNREDVLNEIHGARKLFVGDYSQSLRDEEIKGNGYFIIATHSHQLDYVVLKRIYEAGWRPGYIGMVASRKKRTAMIERLTDELSGKPDLSILYSPVGLDIGGSSPQEIALSIVAEIQAVRYNKTGHKHMRDL